MYLSKVVKLLVFALVSAAEGAGLRPVVLWHGLGDYYNSDSQNSVAEIIHQVEPDISVYPIYVSQDEGKDQQASILGDLNTQLDDVCDRIKQVDELKKGFDAIGFSQGGLFLRALLQRCDVKMHNLITFGSPHNGISDLPPCSEGDWLCKRRNRIVKGHVWEDRVQHSILAAQYFRDPRDWEKYVEKSAFLADINNEVVSVNKTYRDKMTSLNTFVMTMFDQDETLAPSYSALFFDYNPQTDSVVPFDKTESFKKDLVGLKTLYEQNRCVFYHIDDLHMRIKKEFLVDIVKKYLGNS